MITPPLTPEQRTNYVLLSFLFGEVVMFRAVVEEAAAEAIGPVDVAGIGVIEVQVESDRESS